MKTICFTFILLTGKLQWKKEVDGRILGEIHQVDLFKNGNLQLLFSTQNSLTVLDRDGNSVKPFPLNFKDAVTRPLSVFDYDNNRTYRFVITQGRDLLMYDSKGSIVKGFGFDKAASEISQSPQHIRMGNKDYIVFPEKEGKLNILSRQGKQRVKVNTKLDLSENGWFENNGNFVSVNTEGELLKINENGKINREKSGFEVPPFLTATENTLVLQSENILKINDNTVTLDFGLYTRPQIFEIGGKTFITITDTQSQKVFIFNEDATLVQGFPVYGTSSVDIYQAEDGAFILGVLGEKNSAILYRYN
ncbi:hypothetical protein LZ575_12335 [Antarcticibacterium sp. 1MA-6-2]|uniref:hypothetical protein n=1 Tax=Antarcticibacterium sp. 1MA-6-2 TaxID=2908210 RepID=UPI001F2C0027|nr:hypothetical protein [Antarcticibacterium sp. 1MA-6-2]UJH89806.1 hypothetical protein LZ575_12335 [Antarcticibacterium sp. 1MA-6-2]